MSGSSTYAEGFGAGCYAFNAQVFCRVEVTEEFPFLVTKLSPYFNR